MSSVMKMIKMTSLIIKGYKNDIINDKNDIINDKIIRMISS